MKLTMIFLLIAATQAATRNVHCGWTASTSAAVVPITYNVLRCQVVVSGGTCIPSTKINTIPVTGTTYVDSTAVEGDVYWYGVEAVAPACTSVITKPCGTSSLLRAAESTAIPPPPAQPSATATATITVTITGKGIVIVVE